MRSTETTETMSSLNSELQIIHKNKVYTKRNLKKKVEKTALKIELQLYQLLEFTLK